MKNCYKLLMPVCLLLLCSLAGLAQKKKIPPKIIPLFTADSLISGNTKDVLANFFQLGIDNLTGENKEFKFNANPFAIMLKSNPELNVDHYYSKYNALRKLNIGFAIMLDSSNNFSGFSSGLKYALINQRDHTTSRLFATNLRINGFLEERTVLNGALREFAINRFSQSGKTDDDRKIRNDFFNQVSDFFNEKIAFNKLDPDFQKLVLRLSEEKELENITKLLQDHPESNLKTNDIKVFEDLKDSIKTAALWTVGFSDTTYNSQFAFSNLVLNSEFSKGIFTPRAGANNLELNIKAAVNFLKDTMKAGNNLKRAIFNLETGVNWVIRDRSNDRPMFELKFGGGYRHNFTSLYTNEKRDLVTINTTLRVRIYGDLWIPIEFRYDPASGKVFSLFNIKANFTGLGKLLNS